MTVREWFRVLRGSAWEQVPRVQAYVMDDSREKGFYIVTLDSFGDYHLKGLLNPATPRTWMECRLAIEDACAVEYHVMALWKKNNGFYQDLVS